MAFDNQTKREFKVIGRRVPRPDGLDKVTGKAAYGADISAPGMLHGRILRSPVSHGEIARMMIAEDTRRLDQLVTSRWVLTTCTTSPECRKVAQLANVG